MVIHLTSRMDTLTEDIGVLREITNVVYRLGHTLARNWFEPYFVDAPIPPKWKHDWERIYRECIESIDRSDLIIAESSGYGTFGVGFQVALALAQKKPILVLSRHTIATGVLPDGIREQGFVSKEYTLANLESIVKEFIRENTITSKDLRFNFVIDRQIYNHLRAKSLQGDRTKAEVLRDLLIKDMESAKD